MSLFKEPFDKTVADQLHARQDLIGKNEYNPQDITYLNSKTAWISLKSSVNAISPTSNSPTNSTTDYSALAKNNVLLGGLFNSKSPYIIEKDALGMKPMPGITNISVKNKGAYGSLRQVTVNFQCWDVKQLQRLELLYMRPGFTVLLEWGWLPYIDNGGKLKNELHYDDKFFDRKDVDLQEYFKELNIKTTNSSGNYDFMFGYVMNYSWKFRDDGGYDCSTEIISTGEILESYKINFATPEISAKSFNNTGTIFNNTGTIFSKTVLKLDEGKLKLIKKDYSQNIIRGLCSELFFRAESDGNLSSGISDFNYVYENNTYSINFISLDFLNDSSSEGDNKCSISGDKNIYITLGDFVTLMNNIVLIKNPNNTKKSNVVSLSVKDRRQSSKGNNEPLTCLYHPLQISIDPTVCLIKNRNFLPITLKNKFTPEVITYKVQEGNPAQKKKAYDIFRGIQLKIPKDKLILYFQRNIGNLDDLLSIEKEYLALPENKEGKKSLYDDIIRGSADGSDTKLWDKEIDAVFSNIEFPPLGNIDKPKASYFLNFPYENRKKYIQNAEDRINKKNEKEYNESVEAATSFFEKLDSVKGKEFADPKSEKGIIENIYINLKYIYLLANNPSLEAQDPSEKNSIELMTFLRTMLRDIQSSIGNVNNFEIFNEENVGYIIDLNASVKEEFKPFKFEVGNRNSIVRSINLESQIFSNQSTIIAISAQSDPGKLGLENSSMVAYNRGITDRMISKKDINLGDPSIEKKDNGFAKLLINLKEYFQGLAKTPSSFDPFGFSDPSLSTESIGTYKNALRDAIVFYTSQFKADNKYKDILPTKLSITMDGIGGIIIGNIFDISKDIFPPSYVGTQGIKLYYTVTGVGQDVSSDGQWITTIEGNPFIPDSSFDTSKILTVGANFNDYDDTPSPLVLVSSENVNEPPVTIVGDVKRMCVSMNSIFKGKTIRGDGNCGRWTYSIARNYIKAKIINQNMLPGTNEGSGGNAKEQGYRNFLMLLGYKEVAILNKIDKATLARRLDTAPYQIGDVVVYWSDNPIAGLQENAYIYGHTQIYTGGVRYDPVLKSNVADPKQIRWACDGTYNYGTNFVYRSAVNVNTNLPESWNFILLRP
jgi:hypothetical protein